MYQYANELAERGHSVTIYHAIERLEKKSLLPSYIKLIVFKLRNVSRPSWFPLRKNIDSRIITAINNNNIKDADIILSTWWSSVFLINNLSDKKGKRFNLIQDYERWKGNADLVHQSYSLPVNHMVIANYLSDLFESFTGRKPLYLPNAINLEKFFLRNPVENRAPATICMLYSRESRKGTQYGMEALEQLKKQVPDLKVDLFSVYPDPGDLPEWISYNHKNDDLGEIYNRNAIFFSPSLGEGWALPPAEAMACGCAIVCTDIGGHHDYGIDGTTALLVTPKDVTMMVEKLALVISDNKLRWQLAHNANTYLIENFSWSRSVSMLEGYFELES